MLQLPLLLISIEKLLAAKDMQVDRLATEKAAKTLNDIADKASE